MKKLNTFLLVLFLCVTGSVYSQTQEDIYRESNPEENVVDNSTKAQEWAQIVEARKSGNENYYFELLNNYRQKYEGDFKSVRNPFNGPQVVPVSKSQNAPFNQDWIANGDNIVSYGGVPNPGIFERNLRLRIDSLGTQYVAYISTNRDSLVIYRSTNGGVNFEFFNLIVPGGSNKWHSFDMFITDSTGGHILGIVASRTPNTSSYAGELYWLSFKSSGSFLGATLITPTESGRGNIEPSVISDGRDWSVSLTYWYVAFRNVDASTGVGDSAVTSYSSNWGHGWNPPRKIRSFDDYDLSINYNYESDSIYVLLTNSLTPSNPNLRLMRIYLGNLGTGTSWTQFNPANTPDPETLPQLAVNREVNEMAITYTREESGLKRIYYNYYTPGGAYWSNSAPVFVQPEAQNVSTLDCNIGQWAYRLCFRVIGGNDTIVYMNSGNISTGFAGRTQVSNHKPTGTVAPVIAGYTVPSNGGAVVYAGFGATPIYYDNSSIATNITSNGEIAPESFKLSQNYPNPFNPTTNIKFDIINKGNVKLVVFDATGREVTTLVNDNLDPGSYEVNFDASKLSSGVYFYKLTSGEFSDLKKMVLVK